MIICRASGWMDGHTIICKRQWTKSSFRKWPEYFLATMLYPSQTDRDGGCVCVCENVRQIAVWAELGVSVGGLDRVLQGKDLLRANFHSASLGKKTTNENLHPAQQLHHNDPSQHHSLTGICAAC